MLSVFCYLNISEMREKVKCCMGERDAMGVAGFVLLATPIAPLHQTVPRRFPHPLRRHGAFLMTFIVITRHPGCTAKSKLFQPSSPKTKVSRKRPLLPLQQVLLSTLSLHGHRGTHVLHQG